MIPVLWHPATLLCTCWLMMQVSRLAALHGIQLRTGCFCNPGACAKYLGLTGGAREGCWVSLDVAVPLPGCDTHG
jgi:hypothetical protein